MNQIKRTPQTMLDEKKTTITITAINNFTFTVIAYLTEIVQQTIGKFNAEKKKKIKKIKNMFSSSLLSRVCSNGIRFQAYQEKKKHFILFVMIVGLKENVLFDVRWTYINLQISIILFWLQNSESMETTVGKMTLKKNELKMFLRNYNHLGLQKKTKK